MGGYALRVDFGTSSTVAVLSGPDGRARPLLFDASPLLPSGVFAGAADSPLLTGADAERAALADPAGFGALSLIQQTGDRLAEAHIWHSLGHAHHHLGDLRRAVSCYRRSLDLFRRLGDRRGEAVALAQLGDTQHITGDVTEARRFWRQAL
ncbi:tetratricopeptide repeat protein, partial [Plantactinospora mayteni]|uniref:tetratricopeptide repeat protein n=1 Tax=Plantactinospora mayteni TaxID=566021 RepID=UPI0031E685F2